MSLTEIRERIASGMVGDREREALDDFLAGLVWIDFGLVQTQVCRFCGCFREIGHGVDCPAAEVA